MLNIWIQRCIRVSIRVRKNVVVERGIEGSYAVGDNSDAAGDGATWQGTATERCCKIAGDVGNAMGA